jgi:hypothetical protein
MDIEAVAMKNKVSTKKEILSKAAVILCGALRS